MKIIFYTCGQSPTEDEKKAIEALGPGVFVRNGSIAGRIDKQEKADEYKGAVPAKFNPEHAPVTETVKPPKKAWGKK